MKRLLIGFTLLAAAGIAAAGLWAWNETRPKTFRGSSTVEFVPQRKPAKAKRPKPERLREPWPTYGYDAQRTRVAPYDLRPPFRGLWSVRTGNVLEFPPVVAYGRVFVGQQRGRFFAIDADSGRIVWRKHFRHCSAASPTVYNGVVYMAYMQPYPCSKEDRTAKGFVVAFRARGGKVLWRFRTGAVESSPLRVRNYLIFGSWNHKLYSVHVKTGKVRWVFEADDELNSSPAHAGRTVYIGSDSGRVYAVDVKTGKLRWRAESFSRFGRREYFYATPTIAYGRVFIGNTDGTLYAFGATSGRLLWAQDAGTYVYTGAAVWNRTVYVGSYDGNVSAFDAATGDLRWRYSAPASIHGAPTVLAGLVYFSTCGTCGQNGSRFAKLGPRTTFALDARTGKLVWTFRDGQYSPLVADQERIYVAGRTRVYALAPRAARRSTAARRAARTTPTSGQTR
jgi:outer membrane protein assembly factor BamB